MKILLCIDDTDDMESRGTGELATAIASAVEQWGWGKSSGVTRHQLLVHPDIPYTSHNSSMCFTAELQNQCLNDVIEYAADFLSREKAEGSDPGLCVVDTEALNYPEQLIEFGYRAKKEVVSKTEAYDLAARLQGVHLSEHGGTGQGIIGALAGAGLRFGGNDGRFKGKLKLSTGKNLVKVRDIYEQTGVDLVRSIGGMMPEQDDLVVLGDTLKAVLLEGKSVFLLDSNDHPETGIKWKTCTKPQLKAY